MSDARHALSALCLAATLQGAHAQDLPRSYAAALEQALSQRPEAGAARAGAAMAAAQVRAARSAFLPTLTAYSSVRRSSIDNDLSPGGVYVNYANQNLPVTVAGTLPPYGANIGLDVRYRLYAGGADRARLDAARAGERATQAGAQLTRRQLVEDVTRAYWAVVKARIDARRTRRALDLARAEAEMAAERVRQGNLAAVEAEVSALAAQVRESEWRNSERVLTDLIHRYLLAVGLDVKPPHVEALRGMAPEDVEGIDALDPHAVLEGLGLVKAARIRKEIAEFDGAAAAIAQARAERKPTLDFFAGYSGGGRSAAGLGSAIGHYGRDFSYVGLQLTWTLFDGYRADSRIDHAVAAAEKQRWMIEQARRGAEQEGQAGASRLAGLREQLELAGRQLALSEAQLKVANMREETRLGSRLQARAAREAMEEARDRLASLKVDVFVARVEMLLALSQ